MKLLTLLLFYSAIALGQPLAVSSTSGETVHKSFYSINYNEQHEVPNWVEYSLEAKQLKNCVSRGRSFRQDPRVSTGSADLEDYRNSGFDRGHLVPAGDMKFSRKAMDETFFFSNVTPQPAKFNRGKWNHLENLVRSWAMKHEKVWIVTGPILKNSLPWIGHRNQVSVPDQYFKVILRREKTSYRGIAFLVSTSVPYPELAHYSLKIDDLEIMTEIDFFPFLTKAQEKSAESRLNLSDWDFNARFEYLPCSSSAAQLQK